MATNNAVTTKWVWQNIDEVLAEAIVEFWLEERALLDKTVARSRVSEVILIAQDRNDKIVGVTTMQIKYSGILENEFCFWRQFVAKSMRQSRLASVMGVEAYEILEHEFLKGNLRAKGLIVVVENPFMNDYLKAAILAAVPFVYFGNNANGQQMRVCYFKGAKVLENL